MAQKVTVTIPDSHYDWLIHIMTKRGWDNVQDAIRSVIEDSFRLDKRLGGKIDNPVSLKVAEAQTQTSY